MAEGYHTHGVAVYIAAREAKPAHHCALTQPPDQQNIVQPQLSRKDSKQCFQWRIRNLPYSADNYSISANSDKSMVVVRTKNKKCVPMLRFHLTSPPRRHKSYKCIYEIAVALFADSRFQCRYFKQIPLPELELLGLPCEENRLNWQHANNTLIISYSKPPEVREADALEFKELQRFNTSGTHGHTDCKQQ
jgi:protein DPCD